MITKLSIFKSFSPSTSTECNLHFGLIENDGQAHQEQEDAHTVRAVQPINMEHSRLDLLPVVFTPEHGVHLEAYHSFPVQCCQCFWWDNFGGLLLICSLILDQKFIDPSDENHAKAVHSSHQASAHQLNGDYGDHVVEGQHYTPIGPQQLRCLEEAVEQGETESPHGDQMVDEEEGRVLIVELGHGSHQIGRFPFQTNQCLN